MSSVDPDQGVYGISVAAELVSMGTQTLRLYEARGLVQPDRTAGGTRRYSANDLERLRHIGELLDAGLNLAGIGAVLDLEEQNDVLETQNSQLRSQIRAWHATAPSPTRRRPARDDAPPTGGVPDDASGRRRD